MQTSLAPTKHVSKKRHKSKRHKHKHERERPKHKLSEQDITKQASDVDQAQFYKQDLAQHLKDIAPNFQTLAETQQADNMQSPNPNAITGISSNSGKTPLMQPVMMIGQNQQDTEAAAQRSATISWSQLNIILNHAKHSGQLTSFAFWLCFLVFTMLVDYMKNENSGIFAPTTYDIVAPYDLGIGSNIKSGKVGWPIALCFLLAITVAFTYGLWSRNLWFLLSSIGILLSLELVWLFVAIFGNGSKESASKTEWHTNLVFVIVFSISWIFWHLFESFFLYYYVKKINDDDSPQETSLAIKEQSQQQQA